ncbi:hypothetical protein C0995_011679 [Termitomyces sp. Mi166|nr:hypothetical protein C0995_011679 [Termitomyces sp. Mi166\
MDGNDDAANEPNSLHFPNSLNLSMYEETTSVGGRHDLCFRRVLQVCPNVDRCQLHSFIENNSHKNPYIIIDHALSAIRGGFISLEIPSLGSSSSKREYIANEGQCGVNEAPKRVRIDYASRIRPQKGGPDYVELSVSQLHQDFSYVEERFIRAVFTSLGSFYAPTHLLLLAKQKEVLKRLHLTAVPALPNLAKSNKGKRRALEDAEFDRERKWLLEVLTNQEKDHAQVVAEGETSQDQIEVVGDDGRMIECGCCFIECASKSRIPCMSTEGCETFFSASALRRALDEKQFIIWERLDQRREIAAAGFVLEDCPFCEFACMISDDQATIFVCGNTEKCGKVRDDEIRGGRHAIAEAMSHALMRNCPKCDKPFIKDDGSHPGRRRIKKSNGKCPLFDAETDRHNNDVIQAATAALDQVKRDLPNIEQSELQVELPPPPRQKPTPRPRRPRMQRRPQYPVLLNNHHIPGILQQAAPLLALAPQPILPIDLMHDQSFAPQVGPIALPGTFGNMPLPMLRQQQFMPAQADNVFPQPRFDMVFAPPRSAVALKPLPPLFSLNAPVPPPPQQPPLHVQAPLQHLLHIHDQYGLNGSPTNPPDLLTFHDTPALTAPPPGEQLNNLSFWNRLQAPDPMLFPEQVPRQPIDAIPPMLSSLSAPPLQTQHQQVPSFAQSTF